MSLFEVLHLLQISSHFSLNRAAFQPHIYPISTQKLAPKKGASCPILQQFSSFKYQVKTVNIQKIQAPTE